VIPEAGAMYIIM